MEGLDSTLRNLHLLVRFEDTRLVCTIGGLILSYSMAFWAGGVWLLASGYSTTLEMENRFFCACYLVPVQKLRSKTVTKGPYMDYNGVHAFLMLKVRYQWSKDRGRARSTVLSSLSGQVCLEVDGHSTLILAYDTS